MAPTLNVLADGGEHSLAELRRVVADRLSLAEEDLRAKIPSGTPLLANRLHWAVTYMYQAGLLSRPKRGVVRITDRGRKVAAAHPDRIDVRVLSEFPEFIDFKSRSRPPKQTGEPDRADDGSTPREAVATAVDEANAAVAAEVLDRVRLREPAFLERLVLEVNENVAAGRNLVSGALRVACCLPAHALPAPIARIIALRAPTTLGLSGTPFHEPFHGRGAADSEVLDRVIVDRQGSDADIGRCGAAGSPAQWAASTNTYSDALCLALHAISADRCALGMLGAHLMARTEQVVR